MSQMKHETKRRGLDLLKELKVKRGGEVLEFHKRIANDPDLLAAFTQQFDICYKNLVHLPRKYRELIMVAIGCARNAQTTINVHAKLALEYGATIEELGETLRLVFFLSGATSLIPGSETLEPLEME